MKTILHKADTRGVADYGWLQSKHSFSFAGYQNPERVHFGALRVLNDDIVTGGRGFDTHPHKNMEIISIPLSGALEHKDSMGNRAVIEQGDIQVMSAGTGVSHSEYNKNDNENVSFLQIWLFPNEQNVSPRYDQIKLDEEDLHNKLCQVLSPHADDEGVWIHQDAWFYMGHFDAGITIEYDVKNKSNGLYVFVLEGDVTVERHQLNRRDGFGVWETEKVVIEVDTDAQLLLMEVPMVF